MKIIPSIIASAALLLSCDAKKSSAKSAETAVSQNATLQVADTATSELQAQNISLENGAATSQNKVNPVAVNKPGAKPALNPAHGEPFHRCDIQVGAPIDSAPQQMNAPQTMPQPGTNNSFNTNPISTSPAIAPAAPVQATGPKPALNPAHGEPHHRCDLQVGAPLT